MLKYLLSTLCVFLFFEDVRLNHYKCADPDCSVQLSKARVINRYFANSDRGVNVKPGDVVYIYGIDPERKTYLVKVDKQDGFRELPKDFLQENHNVLQRAKYDVTDPFQQNQSPQITKWMKGECTSEIERFKSIVLDIRGPTTPKASLNPGIQTLSDENEVTKPLTEAASGKNKETPADNSKQTRNETAEKPKILESNTSSENNEESANSEINTQNGTEKNDSKSTQNNSTVKDHNQTNINEEESHDVTVEDVHTDSIEQINESQITENGVEKTNIVTSDTNSPGLPSQTQVPDQPNPAPKITMGDNLSTIVTNSASSINDTSDENRTSSVGNESSKFNQSDNVNLNETTSEKSNLSTQPESHAMNSDIAEKNETEPNVDPNLDNPTLKRNVVEQGKDTVEAGGRRMSQGSALSNMLSRNKAGFIPPVSINGSARSKEVASAKKSEPSTRNASSNSDPADSGEKKNEIVETPESNLKKQEELKNTSSPADKHDEISQKKIQTTASPLPNSSSFTDSLEDPKIPVSSAPAEESGSSIKNFLSNSSKSGAEKPAPAPEQPTTQPSTTPSSFTHNSYLSEDRKDLSEKPGPSNDGKPMHHTMQSGSSSKPPVSETPIEEPKPSNDSSAEISVSSTSTEKSASSDKNVLSNSSKSGDEKRAPAPVPPTAPPDTNTQSSTTHNDHKNVPGKPEPSDVNPIPFTIQSASSPEPSEPKPSNESSEPPSRPAVVDEPMAPRDPIADSLNKEDKPDSNSHDIDFSEKPSDSAEERENESAQLLKNTNDMSTAGQAHDGLEDSNQSSENVMTKEESAFYTNIFDYIGEFSSLSENMAVFQSYLTFEWLQKRNDSEEQPRCDEENCSAFSIFDSMAKYGLDMSAINLQSWSLAELHQSKQTSLVAGILLCVVLLFTTLISILRNSKKKSRINTLISVVNQLEKKLLVATKEISLLENQLTDAPVTLISQPATEVDHESSELLQQQIELLQVRNTDLEDKVTYLEKELHNVTTSAFEMHKLLENSLSTQAQSRLAEDEVDTLRSLTERQDHQIDDLVKEMDAIVTENRYLKEDLKKLEKEFSSQTKKNLELTEKNRNLSLRLDQQMEETSTMKNNYKSEIYQLQAKIEDLEINLRRSEFQVESLNRAFMDKHENKSDDQMQALQDDVQLKLQLSTLKAMNNELSAELKEQKNARRTLDDHIGDVIRKCNELTQALEASEKGRNEAVNKLQVLTDYFNEKESQLQKEIAAKEKLFMESENKDQLLSQKLSSLKEEIKNNKDRNEELKKEIEAQERSFKTQLATAEQKSRDLWFALRQAERKYQESEKEAATLRNRMLILENNLTSANQKLNEKHSTNGDINGQPMMFSAEMLSFRGPNDFIPPPPSPLASHSPEFFPPEPSYSPDERLPPLGGRRVPSPPSFIVPPPEDDDFKPPLPHAQFMPGRSRHDSLNMASYYGDNSQHN